jgi:rare lipoprotein A
MRNSKLGYVFLTFAFGFLSFKAPAHSPIIGKMTYYGAEFHGKPTASGEKYNMNALTAAHRTLPFGAILKVTNLANNKSVVVRVNDRGPFGGPGYIIDLSRAAAAKVGMTLSGVALGKIEILKLPSQGESGARETGYFVERNKATTTTKAVVSASPFSKEGFYTLKGQRVHHLGKYGIQIGAYANLDNAKEMYQAVRQMGYQRVFIQVVAAENGASAYRLVVGIYESEEIAKRNLPELQKKKLEGFPVKYF